MSTKLIASVAATAVALTSTCLFAQSNDLSSRISALENQVNGMSGGLVSTNADLSYELLNGASAVDQSANVKNAKLSANSITLGSYLAWGYQNAEYKDGPSSTYEDTALNFGFDAAKVSTVGRIGNDISLVVLSSANVNSNWTKAKDFSGNTRTLNAKSFNVDQAYGLWNVNDQFYLFGGKKDLAFGDFSSAIYITTPYGRPFDPAVNGFGVGSDKLLNGFNLVATFYNSEDSTYKKTLQSGGIDNYAFNIESSDSWGHWSLGYMNHYATSASAEKLGAAAFGLVTNNAYEGLHFSFQGIGAFGQAKGESEIDTLGNIGVADNHVAGSKFNVAGNVSGAWLSDKAPKNLWLLSASYDLNPHSRIGFEYGNNNNLDGDKGQRPFEIFHQITIDLTAWF